MGELTRVKTTREYNFSGKVTARGTRFYIQDFKDNSSIVFNTSGGFEFHIDKRWHEMGDGTLFEKIKDDQEEAWSSKIKG